MKQIVVAVALGFGIAGCSGFAAEPTRISNTPTRIVALSGNMAFGTIQIGSTAATTLAITNSGNATLTVSGISGPGAYTADWKGPILPGASQQVTVRFAPTAAQAYNGTLTVVADHTGGANTILLSGTGTTSSTPADPLTLSGTVTDGSSRGILPNITVYIVSGTNAGKSAVTDGRGEYAMSGLAADTFTMSAEGVNYLTARQPVTLSASTRIDVVLQRAAGSPPTPCSYTLAPMTETAAAAGGNATLVATRRSGDCAWSAATTASWISLTGNIAGSDTGTIAYTVAANATSTARTGTVMVTWPGGSAKLTVSQPVECVFTLDPTTVTIPAVAGNFVFDVTRLAGACSWLASTSATWITLAAGSGSNTSTRVSYAAAALTGPTPRAGRIQVQWLGGSADLVVTQRGSSSIASPPVEER